MGIQQLNSDSKKGSGFRTSFNDVAQFLIAAIMIIGFLALTYVLLTQAPPNTTIIELLAGVFGGWIGAIIGFYFGQRPVSMLSERVEEKSKQVSAREQSITSLTGQLAQLYQELEEEQS